KPRPMAVPATPPVPPPAPAPEIAAVAPAPIVAAPAPRLALAPEPAVLELTNVMPPLAPAPTPMPQPAPMPTLAAVAPAPAPTLAAVPSAAPPSPPPLTSLPPDDLKEIVGIGPILEHTLQSLGLKTFAQIATITPEDVAMLIVKVDSSIAERVLRERWVEQAR